MLMILTGLLALNCPTIALPLMQDSVSTPVSQTATKVEEKKERDPINPDRPGIADGSMVVGPKTFQIELGGQYENHDVAGQGHDRLLFTPVLFRYGFDTALELRIESTGPNEEWQSGQTVSSGYAPVSIGAKYQFQQPSDKNGQLSLGAIARVFPSSGAGGFQSQKTTGDFRLAADWTVAPHWYLNPNLGVGFYENNGRSFTALLGALTLSRDLNSKTQAFIDTGIQGPESWGGITGQIIDIGLTYLPTNDTQLDLSIGTGVSGHTTPHPFVGLGYSIRF